MEVFSDQCEQDKQLFVSVCCSYEPELFPGLIYRMVKPRIVLLIFVSGKVVLTGNETQHAACSDTTEEAGPPQNQVSVSHLCF